MQDKDTKPTLEEITQEFESFLQEYPKLVEAIYHLSRPIPFDPSDSFVVKEVNMGRYNAHNYPLDLRFYKQISRVIPVHIIQRLSKPFRDEISE
ncbi:MAG: hypothetical protein H6555_08235 [Lewinellaceae bacterium]|nr:hypothetical protein [Lewinellaceae bacterium]